MNAKILKDIIQEYKNAQEINNNKMLDIMHVLQNVEVDLVLLDLEIQKDLNILQSLNMIAKTGAFNNSIAH